MKATKNKSGTWTVNVYLGKDQEGHQVRRKFTGQDKRQVLQEAAEFSASHREVQSSDTVNSACNALLNRSDLSPATLHGYMVAKRYLERNEGEFMCMKCYAVRSVDLQKVIDRMAESRKPKTVKNWKGFLVSAFKTQGYDLPPVTLPAKEYREYTIPDETTVRRMLDLAKEENTELYIVISLAAFGAMRAGEVAALAFRYEEDVDFRTDSIHVSHDYVADDKGIYHLKEPKTPTSNRIIQVPHSIMEAIRSQGYVTTWNGKQISSRFHRFLIRHDLPLCRYHDLRHFCASYLHAKGYPDIYIQQRTGHASSDVLRKIYTHALDDQSKLMQQRMILDFNCLQSNETSNESYQKRGISG